VTTQEQTRDWWLVPAQRLINRGVSQSETAAELCRRLDEKYVQIIAENFSLNVNFHIHDGHVALFSGPIENADAKISGTPINLLRLSGDDPESVIRAGDVRISGDAEVAEDFRALLTVTRPDWEEELSHITGDVIAHEVGIGARQFRGWARRAERTLARSLGEYLSEETRSVVTETELEEYCDEVDQLAAGVDRITARLNLLREKRSSAG